MSDYRNDRFFGQWAIEHEQMLENFKAAYYNSSTSIIPGTSFWQNDFENKYTPSSHTASISVPLKEQQIRDAVRNPNTTQVRGTTTYAQLSVQDKLGFFRSQIDSIKFLTPDAKYVSDKTMIRRIFDVLESGLPDALKLSSIECAVDGNIGLRT
jgi:hypothetical protein